MADGTLTPADPQSPPPRPSPSPSAHKSLQNLPFESPEEPERRHACRMETWLLEVKLWAHECSPWTLV